MLASLVLALGAVAMQDVVADRPNLTQRGAAVAVEAALEHARSRSLRVCAVVLDEAGRFVAGQCMDGVTNAAFEVAMAKARHSANFRRPTKFQQDLLVSGAAPQILAIPGMMPLEGGLQIIVGESTVGAIGVSGATSAEDGEIAAVGVQAVASLAR